MSGVRLGPYEIVGPLGSGGMGEVYKARDPRLGRDVAIKVLPAAFSADPERLHRFEQEARAAAALNHPNILAVHDIGQHDGAPYIVSELLEGETLRERLSSGALPVRKAVEYAVQIAHGLAAAHEKGITHRDLKPENVFVTSDGRLKILDFGLAKLTQAEPEFAAMSQLPTTPPNTLPGVVLGTIGYISPDDLAFALEVLSTASGATEASTGVVTKGVARERIAWILAVAGVAILAVTATLLVVREGPRQTASSNRAVTRLELNLPAGVELSSFSAPSEALSPDGTRITFVGVFGGLRQIYIRRLDQFEAVPVRGTEAVSSCFFSPDGGAIGLMSPQGLKKLSLADGLVVTLTNALDFTAEGTWGADDRITFGRGNTLWQISASGGPAKQVTMLDSGKHEVAHTWPTGATRRLVWVSRKGVEEPITDISRPYLNPRLAPDGRRVVVEASESLWTQDTSRATLTRLTPEEITGVTFPAWTADGTRVVFQTRTGLRWVDADGSGRSQAIPDTSVGDFPSSVSPDGETLAFNRNSPDTSQDVYVLSLRGEPKPQPVVKTPAFEGGAQFFPDGHWMAYVSDESGQMQVYVRPFPGPDRKWQVSTEGGTSPRWSRNGKELFYRNANKMVVVDVSTRPELTLSPPRLLFDQRYSFGTTITIPNYDVSPDGQRFVMVKDEAAAGRLNMVLNWFDELTRLAPLPRR